MRRLCVIANPVAAGGRPARAMPSVHATLDTLAVEYEIKLTRSLEHARELARATVADGRVAVGFGGDGLIAAVAGAVAEGDGVLGVLPGGRGNDFARTLGIPLSVPAACEVLASAPARRIDLGHVEGRAFVGIASCGFDSDANRIANATRLVRGNLVYAYGALRALAGWSPATFEVEFDGERRTVTGYSVAAANSRAYGGGMLLAPDASLHDGQLDIVMIAHISKLRLLRLLPSVFGGRHVRERNVSIVRARVVKISADRPFTLYADGDPIAELPVEVGVMPQAVQVIAPAVP